MLDEYVYIIIFCSISHGDSKKILYCHALKRALGLIERGKSEVHLHHETAQPGLLQGLILIGMDLLSHWPGSHPRMASTSEATLSCVPLGLTQGRSAEEFFSSHSLERQLASRTLFKARFPRSWMQLSPRYTQVCQVI